MSNFDSSNQLQASGKADDWASFGDFEGASASPQKQATPPAQQKQQPAQGQQQAPQSVVPPPQALTSLVGPAPQPPTAPPQTPGGTPVANVPSAVVTPPTTAQAVQMQEYKWEINPDDLYSR